MFVCAQWGVSLIAGMLIVIPYDAAVFGRLRVAACPWETAANLAVDCCVCHQVPFGSIDEIAHRSRGFDCDAVLGGQRGAAACPRWVSS